MRLKDTTRLNLIAAFGGACQRCGYNRCTRALHFHHLDATEKPDWSGNRGGASVDEVSVHPDCFLLLCANCHIEEHDALAKAALLMVPCQYCETPFRTTTTRLNDNRGKFCSKPCRSAYVRSRPADMDKFAARFWAKVRKGPGCWEWTGRLANNGQTPNFGMPLGYGRHTVKSVAHIAYVLIHGPLPKHAHTRRLCGNPLCVRPHLDHVVSTSGT